MDQRPQNMIDLFLLSTLCISSLCNLNEVGRMSEDGLSMFNKDGSSVEIIGAEHSRCGDAQWYIRNRFINSSWHSIW